MIHTELQCTNPITGRRVWLLRHIPSGKYGDPVDWVTTAVRRHWFSETVRAYGLCGTMGADRHKVRDALEELRHHLRHVMGFKYIKAERRGKWRDY